MNEFSIDVSWKEEPVKKPFLCDANRFPWDYMHRDPQRVIDQDLGGLFEDMQNGRFWGVLESIDGSNNRLQPSTEKQRQAARRWASERLSHDELQGVLNICVYDALAVPYKTGWPGSYKGHSILYSELVEKPDSMFGGAVTEGFKRRLNNGRLWEEIPDMMIGLNGGQAYRIVDDVLINHYDDLDPKFAPQGFRIFKRNLGVQPIFDLSRLTDAGVDGYGKFFDQVNQYREQLGLTPEQLAPLIRPYVAEIIRTQGDYHDPRFKKVSARSFIERLQEPLVVEYATGSSLVREALAETLGSQIDFGNWEHALDVIPLLPNPQEIFDQMTRRMRGPKYSLTRLAKGAQEVGLDLIPLLGPRSLRILRNTR